MLKVITALVLVLFLATGSVFASGFSIYEHGSKATAMGGAFIAQANDVTSVFYNPAGITSLPGTNFGLGVTVIMPEFSFTGPVGISSEKVDAEKLVFFPPHFYLTHQFNDQWSVGFGIYSMFGLKSKWQEGWVGRELNVETGITTIFFNPVVAFRPIENLSIAAGASLVYGDVQIQYDNLVLGPVAPPSPVYVNSNLEGTTTGWGFNAAVKYNFTEQLAVGFHYRHNVKLNFDDGEATFSRTGIALIDPLFPSPVKGKAEIELPNMIGAGISYDFSEQFTAEFDFMQLGWSSYDKLQVEFEQPVAGRTVISDDKNYEDSYSLRFGLEYRVNECWSVRGGYLRDNHAVPDNYVEPTLPEGDRSLYSLGFGWRSEAFSIDGYAMMLTQDDRDITNSTKEILDDPNVPNPPDSGTPFNGLYEGGAWLFGITLGYAIK